MKKYFLAENANRFICGVKFEPIGIMAGTLRGVYSTDNEQLAALLLKERGVREITEAEYDDRLKKKARGLDSLPNWKAPVAAVPSPKAAQPVPASLVALNDKVGVVVDKADPKPDKSIKTTADALKLDHVDVAVPPPNAMPTPTVPPSAPAPNPSPAKPK